MYSLSLSFFPLCFRFRHPRLLNTLPSHAPAKHKRRRRGSSSKIKCVLYSLVISQDNTRKVMPLHNLSHSRSACSNNRLRADVGSKSTDCFDQAVTKVCFGKCQEQGTAEDLSEDDEGHADGHLVSSQGGLDGYQSLKTCILADYVFIPALAASRHSPSASHIPDQRPRGSGSRSKYQLMWTE